VFQETDWQASALLNSRSFPGSSEKTFQLFGNNRGWADRDRAPRTRRRCGMAQGRRVGVVDAGQRGVTDDNRAGFKRWGGDE
jgi:hypothetical protein